MRLGRSDPPGSWLDEVGAGQAQLAPTDLAWLRDLPEEVLVTEGVWVCHGMPGNPWNSIWPRSPGYGADVSDADRAASLRVLADLDVELVLCGHEPEPRQYQDGLPDGRELRVVRAGPRTNVSVGYAVLTRTTGAWDCEWYRADNLSHEPRARHFFGGDPFCRPARIQNTSNGLYGYDQRAG